MPWAGTVPSRSLTTSRPRTSTPVSATLAANEALARRRQRGEPVLPLAFGEAGLPVVASLQQALSAAASRAGYGPVAGQPELREAVAGYWSRRDLPTGAEAVVCGPGSKPLLFATMLAVGGDLAVPQPSWVSYAAQGRLAGVGVHHVAAPPGEGGICDPDALADAVAAARAADRRIGAVIVTLPDNPTGRLARPATVRALCAVAAAHDLIVISDEIYRDLIHDPAADVLSPAAVAPERTVVTTALSKNLALGGWRLGAARMPDGLAGAALRDRVIGVASEIWSAPAAPVQQAATLAFSEPQDVRERISASRSLHAALARAVADRCAAAGLLVPAPQAAFYVYPDFEPWRGHLRATRGIRTGAELAAHLLKRYGAGVLPGSAFGEQDRSLRIRMATAQLYGETDEQRERALAARDPAALPWVAAALTRLADILADLAPPVIASAAPCRPAVTAPAA